MIPFSLSDSTGRQKIERISSAGFDASDFAEFEFTDSEVEAEDGGENAVEKGGLFVAGNIAGAKGQQVCGESTGGLVLKSTADD